MTSSSDARSPFGRVRELIQAQLVELVYPSLAVTVAQNGEILWEDGFGWADRERRLPATPHTLYSLASVTKPFTATALMMLVERGSIDLDRPINDYLVSAKVIAHVGDAADATVRRVANHTAGLPVHYQFFYADEPYRRPPMEETIRRYGHLVWAPGERYEYSNLGYGILDYVIARISGKSYADFLRQELFLPLGMTHASVGIGPGLESFAAARYGEDGVPYPFYDFDHPGGSAVYSSAHDLIRFALFHLKTPAADQKAILRPESIDAMQIATTPEAAPEAYGIGWSIDKDYLGYPSVHHTGGMAGVATVLHMVPSERLAVVALGNALKNDMVRFAVQEILGALLPGVAERRAERAAKQQELGRGSERQQATFIPPHELLGDWRGQIETYQGDRPLALSFKESGDVHVQVGTQLKTLLNEVRLAGDRLTGCMMGDMGTEDARRRSHQLELSLCLRGDVLNGAITAITINPDGEGGAPGKWIGNALSHWVELRKMARP